MGHTQPPMEGDFSNSLFIAHQILKDLLMTKEYLEDDFNRLNKIERKGLVDVVRFNVVSNMSLGRSNILPYLTDPSCLADFHLHTHGASPSPADLAQSDSAEAPSLVISYTSAGSSTAQVYLIKGGRYESLGSIPLD